MRIVLRFGDEFATATLSDTPAAREFAAMLPLQLRLRDPMGQAKSGPLPRPIDAAGGEPVVDPAVGGIYYYSANSSTFAIFYDDLGQSIPD
ncbi:MAG: cyclophilin-like fold protein, partial [Nocardioides sp.]